MHCCAASISTLRRINVVVSVFFPRLQRSRNIVCVSPGLTRSISRAHGSKSRPSDMIRTRTYTYKTVSATRARVEKPYGRVTPADGTSKTRKRACDCASIILLSRVYLYNTRGTNYTVRVDVNESRDGHLKPKPVKLARRDGTSFINFFPSRQSFRRVYLPIPTYGMSKPSHKTIKPKGIINTKCIIMTSHDEGRQCESLWTQKKKKIYNIHLYTLYVFV